MSVARSAERPGEHDLCLLLRQRHDQSGRIVQLLFVEYFDHAIERKMREHRRRLFEFKLVEGFDDIGGVFFAGQIGREPLRIASSIIRLQEALFHGSPQSADPADDGEPICDQAIRAGVGVDNRLGPSLGTGVRLPIAAQNGEQTNAPMSLPAA